MKKYSSLIIGHITLDENIDYTGEKTVCEGGAVLYSSAAAYGVGHEVAALTKLAEKDKARLAAFNLPLEDIYCVFGEKSTDMYNHYLTPDKERRDSRCPSRGDPFKEEDIPDNIQADIYHFAGLLYGDFNNDLIITLSKKSKIGVDVQGFLRHRNKDDGRMYFEDWSDKKQMLKYIDFLKTDAAEAEILTGTDDRRKAAEILYSFGANEIVITHNTEVLAYDGKNFYTCPIKARNLVGRTGRGDTTFAVYLNERLEKSIPEALLFATATVSLKMESKGVFSGNRQDVENYIEEFYK